VDGCEAEIGLQAEDLPVRLTWALVKYSNFVLS